MSKSSSSKPKPKAQHWDIPDFDIPEAEMEWEDLVARAKLGKTTINTLPKEMFKSASQVTPKQFTMLRVYAPELESIESFRENGGIFFKVVETDTPINSIGEKDNQIWPGSFVAARRLQEQAMTVEGIHDRDRAEVGPPASKRLRCRSDTTSRPEGKKPLDTLKDLPDAEDEATPNAALVVFLQCLTGLVTGLPIEWVLNRTSFTPMFGKGGYNTVTDGVLRVSKTLAPLSIVEAKKRVRYKRTAAIIMQEGCELVGWLKESSHSLPAFNNHLLLVSQDRHEIFLTFAAYTQAYKGYLEGEEARADSFLVMKTFGPWRTCDPAQMSDFGHILLAIVLVAKGAA
ncbi:hypothetical protein IFM51744_09869 [Aspergillus udagawae]|uniref:Uncharacterized protein n=1 Tax=Aspergillus udagawae TaxID=91492 RepID=A0ABQ1BAU0_9EURO|nr:hypothetical protein IFM51744_09869 [Aspergillus udagawae]GFF97564.1 hypothetical protein IFM53868_09187 [Aspergillus udagawae]